MNPGDVEITPQFDTGDLVVHKPSQTPYMVACVHGYYLHTAGYPEQRLMVGDCVLQRRATETERRNHLGAMAQSTSQGHRASCARQRLAEINADEVYYDPCYADG